MPGLAPRLLLPFLAEALGAGLLGEAVARRRLAAVVAVLGQARFEFRDTRAERVERAEPPVQFEHEGDKLLFRKGK